MKKSILLVLLVSSFFSMSTNVYCDDNDLDEEINLKIGIDLKKQFHGLSYDSLKETNSGFSLGIENLVPVYDYIRCGIGLEYCAFPVKINKMALSAVDIYATLKVKPFMNSDKLHLRRAYLKINLGYSKVLLKFENLFRGGGLYFAIGPGIETPKGIFFELNGSILNSLSAPADNIDDIDSSFFKVGLNVGYKI
jgi:hypothetical protein